MAEFEIIGDEKVGEEEMDDATRAFLEEEQAQLAAMGISDNGFGGEENADDFGGFEGEAQHAHEEDPFGAGSGAGNVDAGDFGHHEQGDAFGQADDFGQAADFGTGGYSDDFHGSSQHMDTGLGGFEDTGLGNGDFGAGIEHDEGFGAAPESDDPYAAIGQVDAEMAEPDSVRKWREDMAARIAEIDARSAEKKQEMLTKAKQDLETFYTNYDSTVAKAKEGNREAESSSQQAREVPTGSEWEQACGMCDFNPKAQVGLRDKSRMRGLLLQLKQTPLVR